MASTNPIPSHDSTALRVLLVATTVVTGLMAGFFYAYACSVMIGLADASDATFIEAMQQINANVRNAWFGPVFFGSVALPAVTAVVAIRSRSRAVMPWIVLALVFAAVAFGITLGVSVPLNDELADAGPVVSIADLAAVRDDYEAPWVRWNVARTVASTLALAACCLALLQIRPAQQRAEH